MKRASLTFVFGAAIALGPALGAVQTGAQSVQYRSPAGVEYRSLPDTEAVTKAQAALAADPRNVARIIDLGVAQSGARQFREAIATFTRGLEIEPNNALLLRWRGHRYLSVREFDRALADLTRGSAHRQHDLRHLVSPRDRPVRARRVCRGRRVVCQGAAHRAGSGRAGWFHRLVVDVAQPRRSRRGSEGDARSPARITIASPSTTPTRAGCSSIAARSDRMRWSRRRTPTKFRSRRSPTASATGISSAATRRRRASGSNDRFSRAAGRASGSFFPRSS